jgi:hypothetical protein
MAEVTADRRDFPRHALTLVAHGSEPGGSTVLIARSSDVSRSGCYIDTLNPLPPGTMINIQSRSGEDSFETLAQRGLRLPGTWHGCQLGDRRAGSKTVVRCPGSLVAKAARTSI